ncbi:hypothetical protein RvY_16698 [Ramazzottius varieornatus]|uniref:A-kinase anchor protein 7-like phosphoesterase domain-containing protein n=1 Tax=Ramazzottius varieornatus TaxID=947166 RepID=A0A1D1VZF1_RAMVA|nr:hypothetical protein RvY_16698 [Ramazzottius varieornatus]
MNKIFALGSAICVTWSSWRVLLARCLTMATDEVIPPAISSEILSSTTAMILPRLARLFPGKPDALTNPDEGDANVDELDLTLLFEEGGLARSVNGDIGKNCVQLSIQEKHLVVKRSLHDSVDRQRAKKEKGPAKKMPNYFVAVPVENPAIREAGLAVQECIIKANESWKSAMVSVRKFHITLMVLCLGNEEEIERAHRALQASKEKIHNLSESESQFPELRLDFKGLESFGNQVLYINPVPSDGLTRLHEAARVVRETFAAHGLGSTDKKVSFEPHLTLMKLSKAPQLRRKGLKIPPDVYAEHLSLECGSEVISSLQLCSMMLPQDKETGYYFVSKQVDLNVPEEPLPHPSDETDVLR